MVFKWIKRILRILFCEAAPFWLFVIVLYISIFFPFIWCLDSSDHVHYSSSILQLIAFVFLVHGISKIYKSFKGEHIYQLLINWFKRLFHTIINPKPSRVNEKIPAAKISISGVRNIEDVVCKNEKTLEVRVSELENSFKYLEDKQKSDKKELSDSIEKKKKELRNHLNKVQEEQREEKRKVEKIELGNLYNEFVAMLWLITALIFNTFPDWTYDNIVTHLLFFVPL